MSVRCWLPCSPADSIPRSPAPTIRSRTLWEKITVFTRSSGISIPFLAMNPSEVMIRSVVNTKLVVNHLIHTNPNQIAVPTIAATRNHFIPSATMPLSSSMAMLTRLTITATPKARPDGASRIRWGRRSRTNSSPSLSNFRENATSAS